MSSMPTPTAIRIIREEHQALSAMLSSLHLLLRQHRQDGAPVRFDVLRAMLFYIDEFPERLHHRKESDLLFPLIRQRSDRAAEALEKLDRDHGVGERAIRDLEHALLAWEMLGESRRADFEQAVERYLSFYLKHMQMEEEIVLPLAQQVLEPADWAVLDEAFGENRDPLTGHPASADYEQLFSRIVRTAPAPIGLGAAA
jgi:hemerythrin-like domain-containing protein